MTTFLTDVYSDGILVGKPHDSVGLYQPHLTQLHPIGTKLELHGRTFRYSRAIASITLPHRGCPNLAYFPWKEEGSAGNLYSVRGLGVDAALSGSKKITVVFDDYIADTSPYNSRSKNYFAGGWAVVFNIGADNGIIGTFRISGNEASIIHTTATQESMVVYLDDPLPYTLTPAADPATSVDLYPSAYLNVGASSSVGTHGRVVVVPLTTVTSGYYFWGQTKGPAWVTPTAGITTANIHEVGFHIDGTVKTYTAGLQCAGYMIMRGDGSGDDSLIQLMLE